MLLTLSTMSTLTMSALLLARPSAPTSPVIVTPHGLAADMHCGAFACPGPDAHAFCRELGCDYCVVALTSVPTTHYEGDREATGRVSLVG